MEKNVMVVPTLKKNSSTRNYLRVFKLEFRILV